jgi:hypothetical protein
MHYPYSSIVNFQTVHRLTLPKNEVWRLTEPRTGEINGLPESRGTVVATNGILCYILQGNNHLYLGHFEWFITDNREPSESIKTFTVPPPQKPQSRPTWLDLLKA